MKKNYLSVICCLLIAVSVLLSGCGNGEFEFKGVSEEIKNASLTSGMVQVNNSIVYINGVFDMNDFNKALVKDVKGYYSYDDDFNLKTVYDPDEEARTWTEVFGTNKTYVVAVESEAYSVKSKKKTYGDGVVSGIDVTGAESYYLLDDLHVYLPDGISMQNPDMSIHDLEKYLEDQGFESTRGSLFNNCYKYDRSAYYAYTLSKDNPDFIIRYIFPYDEYYQITDCRIDLVSHTFFSEE